MSQLVSEVVGVIELEIDEHQWLAWLEDDDAEPYFTPPETRPLATAATIVRADVARLSLELQRELFRVLQPPAVNDQFDVFPRAN